MLKHRLKRQMAVRHKSAPPPREPPAKPPDPPHDPSGPGPSSRTHAPSMPPTDCRPGVSTQLDPVDVEEYVDASDEQTHGTNSSSSLTVETVSTSYNLVRPCEDLSAVFRDCEIAISRFFNNDLDGAWSVIQLGVGSSIYHTLGAAIFEFIPVMLAFDKTQMEKAMMTIKSCLALCQRGRRNLSLSQSLGNMIRPNFAAYTDHEAHAELVHAEVLLLQACLIAVQGEDFTVLIRSTLKIKACHNGYKTCCKILEAKVWETPESEAQFRSGTRLGMASFNVLISLLPPRLINFLKLVGFSGYKNTGLAELLEGSRATGMRSVLCSLGLLGYNLVVAHFIGAKINFKVCEEILNRELQAHPNGIWFLLFKGRMHLLKKEYKKAMECHNRALSNKYSWIQILHLYYWDFMWLYAVLSDWHKAAEFADKLYTENSWSKTIYSYAKACWLLMMDNPSEKTKKEIDECFDNVILHQQRIAGKSIPIEKFMVRRALRYKAQGNLIAPGYELLCLWNMFNCMTSDSAYIIIKNLENLQQGMENNKQALAWTKEYEGDNLALIRYLDGSIHAALGLPQMAMEALNSVGRLKHRIREDHFLLPFAACEVGYCQHLMGNFQQAYNTFNEVGKKYSGYTLQSRLQMKLQARIATVKAIMNMEEAPSLNKRQNIEYLYSVNLPEHPK